MVDLRTVLHEEAVHTGELVSLRRKHHDVEFDVGEIGTSEIETTGVIGVVDVYYARHLVGDALLEGLDRL